VSVDGGNLLLKVRDNGKGMESPEEGNGLPGMRARAASLWMSGTRRALGLLTGTGALNGITAFSEWRAILLLE